MTPYFDRSWQSADGLRLHYRDYPGSAERPPIVCLPGLTRNARDFEHLALRLAGAWRVLCPEMRGRSGSDYAPDAATYTIPRYVADVEALFAQAGISRFIAVGTSLGGLMTMLLAMRDSQRIAGALLNDIGPVLEAGGLARIATYVGQTTVFADWQEAAAALATTQAVAFPDYQPQDWLAMVQRLMRRDRGGDIVFDYDMKIGESLRQASAGPVFDMWPGIDGLAHCPVLLVRGELSDLLSEDTFAEMRRRLPNAEAVTLPRIGHAPMLDEPEVIAAIDRWLARMG